MRSLAPLLSLALCVGCSGGGSSVPTPIPTTAISQATPTPMPTSHPTATPSPTPTATPTVVALHVAAAPAQVFTTQGLVRRSAAAARQVQTSLGNGQIPTVVGATSPYFGSIFTELYVWADTTANAPVPEASLNLVPANVVSGPVSVSSVTQDASSLASTYFDWIAAFQINKVGQGNVVATFGDGTHGSVPVYIYDQWYVTCAGTVSPTSPMQWAYQGGVPTGQVTPSDMSVNCGSQQVTFTNGAVQTAAPVADAWGNVASAFTTTLSGTTNAAPLSLAANALVPGTIYIAKLSDGGYAKIMPLVNDGLPAQPNISGISLHDNPSGSGTFAF